jgi:hypothetical protein
MECIAHSCAAANHEPTDWNVLTRYYPAFQALTARLKAEMNEETA